MKHIFWLLMLAGCFKLTAQSPVEAGILPEFTLSYQASERWKLTAQLESMQRIWRQDGERNLSVDYDYVRTDFTLVGNYQFQPLLSGGFGYLLRSTNGILVHRTLQQVALVQRLDQGRLGHRLRTDQTYNSANPVRHRLRYRLSWERPLQGQRVDGREFYLISSWEMLGSKQAKDYGLENRLVAGVGYNISNNQQLEIGLDHRWDRLLSPTTRHRIWCTIGYFVGL